jgi:hypothetical protein
VLAIITPKLPSSPSSAAPTPTSTDAHPRPYAADPNIGQLRRGRRLLINRPRIIQDFGQTQRDLGKTGTRLGQTRDLSLDSQLNRTGASRFGHHR